jgi:hypothetical protein
MITTMPPDSPREPVMINLIANGLGAALMGAIGLGFSYLFGWSGNKLVFAAALFFVLGLLLTRFLLKRLQSFSLGLRYMRKHTGIVRTYRNLHECKDEMEVDFRRATNISLLLQIGRLEFGYSELAFFYLLAKQKEIGSHIRILRASDKSPFLSEARARRRGKDPKYWKEEMRRLGTQIEFLRDDPNVKAEIEDRQHLEPYLWRIFIFDDIAYVSAYLHPRENDKKAIVYRLKDGRDSLYPIFKKYFDYLWMEYDPAGPSDPNERWANWE